MNKTKTYNLFSPLSRDFLIIIKNSKLNPFPVLLLNEPKPPTPSHFLSLSLFCLLCFPRRPKFSFPSVHAAAVPVPLLLPCFSLSSWNLTSFFSLLARVLVVTCRWCCRLDLSFVAVSSCSPEPRHSCANLPFSSTPVVALPVLLYTAVSRVQFVVAGAAGGFLSATTVLLSFHSCS